LIAGVVAERVVHELEVVEVEEHHADAELVPASARERELEHLLEQDAVRQARELVVVREERDLLLRPLALGDVEDHALDQPRLAPLVADDERLLAHPQDAAVLVDHPVLVGERLLVPAGLDVLVPDAVLVLRMDVAAPAVRVREPLLRRSRGARITWGLT
jgi:hypothetical protein